MGPCLAIGYINQYVPLLLMRVLCSSEVVCHLTDGLPF
jgi:hypothetical protein